LMQAHFVHPGCNPLSFCRSHTARQVAISDSI
jgi:hypothetical protein